jgi:hypothetical protein
MKNVPSRPPSRISSAPGEDVLLFDNNKSNQNEKCVHKLPSPFAFQSILSSVENRRSITFLESPMPPILLPDGTLRRYSNFKDGF